MADELTIKDVITLFNNELRTEEQLKAKLSDSPKEQLVEYIIEDLKDNLDDDLDDDIEGGDLNDGTSELY